MQCEAQARVETGKNIFALLILLDILQASFTLIKYEYSNIQFKLKTIQVQL